MNQKKARIVEMLLKEDGVRALLQTYSAVYFQPEGVWISGSSGRYAWSHGSTMGMTGEDVYPATDKVEDLVVMALHQGQVAAAFNYEHGIHIQEVILNNGKPVFRMAKTSLFGPSATVDVTWNKDKRQFEKAGEE